MANVQVILKEKIKGLGAEADVVHVKRGFARNCLLPQGRAYEATAGNLRHVENLKAIRAEREAREMAEAEKTAGKLKKLKLAMKLATGQGGKAFGSITTIDLAKAILEQGGVELDRHQIQLERPIKSTGSYDVTVKLHHDISCYVKVNVEAEGAEQKADETAAEEKPRSRRERETGDAA